MKFFSPKAEKAEIPKEYQFTTEIDSEGWITTKKWLVLKPSEDDKEDLLDNIIKRISP